MYQHLTPDYQENVLKRWSKVLEAGNTISDPNTALATALVLENTQREFQKGQRLNESYTGATTSLGGFGAQAGATAGGGSGGGGALGSAFDFSVNDSRIPTIVIPTLRRIFPELLAHNVVGVQPMNGPAGFAFALRAQYGLNRTALAGDASVSGQEIGYNTINSDFTGASGMTAQDESGNYSATVDGIGAMNPVQASNTLWQSFAGTSAAELARANGIGETLANAEWWKVGEDMPMSHFVME